MKVGTLLLILHDVIEDLVAQGLLNADGSFVSPTLAQDFDIAKHVENRAKQRGVVIQDEVDKIINALPLVIALIH